jgi:DNA-binding FadR family transcriptional regulator
MNEVVHQERESDRVVNYFVDRLLTGNLIPGEKLSSEGELCKQFGASRTVIREAIQQLKARGVIATINGKGSYITENQMAHFQDSLQFYSSRADAPRDWIELLSLRSLIETECARNLAANHESAKRDRMKVALDEMRAHQDDLKKFAGADIEYHHRVVELSGNRLFLAVWESLRAVNLQFALDTYRTQDQVKKNLDDHENIYQAILSGDVDAAGQAMNAHLADSRDNLLKMLAATTP